MMAQSVLLKVISAFVLTVIVNAGPQFAYAETVDPNQIILAYSQAKEAKKFDQKIAAFEPVAQSAFRKFISGVYFIDFGHAAPELAELFSGKKALAKAIFPNHYDKPTEPGLEAFRNAFDYLRSQKGKLTLDILKQVQSLAVPWNVDGIQQAGKVRTQFVYGPEHVNGLYPDQLEAINKNPYLSFIASTSIEADVPQGTDQAMNLGRLKGAIIYPRPRDIKIEALNRIKDSHPQVYQAVLAHQAANGENYRNTDPELTHQLATALIEERISTLNSERRKLGALNTPEKIDKYVSLIANFQRDVASIHPFQKGNGRTSRILLYGLALKEGLPIPRLVYPNEDLFWPEAMWTKQVRDGMVATLHMERDLLQRMKTGQRIEKSVALLTPVLPDVIHEDVLIQFDHFMQKNLKNSAETKFELLRDPVGTMRRLTAQFTPTAQSCGSIFKRAN